MLHLSGFPMAPLGAPAWNTRQGRLEAFARWRLNWEPGSTYEYHPTSAHWVLAELIERITGTDFRDVVEERVTAPHGLPRVLGVTDDAPVARLVSVGEPATPEEIKAAFGVDELPVTEVTPEALLAFNQPEVRAVGVLRRRWNHARPRLRAVLSSATAITARRLETRRAGRRDQPRTQSCARPLVGHTGEPLTGSRARRRRGPFEHARHGPHVVGASVRSQRSRRSDRVGRSRQRPVVRLLHARPRPKRGPRTAPHDSHRESRWSVPVGLTADRRHGHVWPGITPFTAEAKSVFAFPVVTTVFMILSAIVCRFTSHSGKNQPM